MLSRESPTQQQQRSSRHQELKRQSRVAGSPPGILQRTSPSTSSSGRLLPYVPKRYVIPPGGALNETRRWGKTRGVSFKDDLVEDIDESGVDVIDGTGESREEDQEEEEDLLEDLPPPADLIDVIGPAPEARAEEIPEPAPTDPDLILNMVTFREQDDFLEPEHEKNVDDYETEYFPTSISGSSTGDYGRRNQFPTDSGEASDFSAVRDDFIVGNVAASRFTYGTYRRHQMTRFERSEQECQPRRRASDQYDSSYFENYSNFGQRPSEYMENELSYPRNHYRRLSDNQPDGFDTQFHGKDSPNYVARPKPATNFDAPSVTYQRPEHVYQNVEVLRDDFNTTSGNGYLPGDYSTRYEKEEKTLMADSSNDFSQMNRTCDWPSYDVTRGDLEMRPDDTYLYSDQPSESESSYNFQLQQEQQQLEQYQQYQAYQVDSNNIQAVPETQPFLADSGQPLSDWSGLGHQGFTPAPPSCAVDSNAQLEGSWNEGGFNQDLTFSFSNLSFDRPDDTYPPRDRLNLIYLTLILHGIGTFMPWNMILTAKELKREDWVYMLTQYFVGFKLGKEYTKSDEPYATYFLLYVGIAAQLPNVVFNWINLFLNAGGNLTSRIVWTLLVEVLVFVATIVLAMLDSSHWPGTFFYLTIGCVAVLNIANGIYQNSVYGVAAKLPFKYTGAVVLGSNISGTMVAIINIITVWTSPNPRTAAIYYFITALFILLACFDTYFALPLNRFYRHHTQLHSKLLQDKRKLQLVYRTPHWIIFKQCLPQCFNIFFTYFVTLTIFPAVCSDIRKAHEDFFMSKKYFSTVTCYFTFSFCSVIGNLFSSATTLPGPRWLFVPVMLRFLFIPLFLLCNYRPIGVERLWPTLIHWDHIYWSAGALFAFTGGYLSSVALMYCPRCVEQEYSSIAGMFGAAAIVTGMIAGIGFSYLMPILISTPALAFEFPDWWPPYVA